MSNECTRVRVCVYLCVFVALFLPLEAGSGGQRRDASEVMVIRRKTGTLGGGMVREESEIESGRGEGRGGGVESNTAKKRSHTKVVAVALLKRTSTNARMATLGCVPVLGEGSGWEGEGGGNTAKIIEEETHQCCSSDPPERERLRTRGWPSWRGRTRRSQRRGPGPPC